jgi:hypothetical protein
MREREVARLNYRLGGLKEMRRLPNLLFIVDIRRDDLAVKEANTLGIPIIAMVDTNCDPDPIDYVIPSNDDAIRAIKLIVSAMASAVLEGQAILTSLQAEEEEVAGMEEEEVLERYLGPSTLAKIQAAAEAEAEAAEEAEPEELEATPESDEVEEPTEVEAEPAGEAEVEVVEAEVAVEVEEEVETPEPVEGEEGEETEAVEAAEVSESVEEETVAEVPEETADEEEAETEAEEKQS